jgi:hypothetical protein
MAVGFLNCNASLESCGRSDIADETLPEASGRRLVIALVSELIASVSELYLGYPKRF